MRVRHNHVYDGSYQAGKPVGPIIDVVSIDTVRCAEGNQLVTVYRLSDGTSPFPQNVTPVSNGEPEPNDMPNGKDGSSPMTTNNQPMQKLVSFPPEDNYVNLHKHSHAETTFFNHENHAYRVGVFYDGKQRAYLTIAGDTCAVDIWGTIGNLATLAYDIQQTLISLPTHGEPVTPNGDEQETPGELT